MCATPSVNIKYLNLGLCVFDPFGDFTKHGLQREHNAIQFSGGASAPQIPFRTHMRSSSNTPGGPTPRVSEQQKTQEPHIKLKGCVCMREPKLRKLIMVSLQRSCKSCGANKPILTSPVYPPHSGTPRFPHEALPRLDGRQKWRGAEDGLRLSKTG